MSVLGEVAIRYGGASTQRGSHMTVRLGACELSVATWSGAASMTRFTLHVPTPGFPEFTVRRRSFFDALVSTGAVELGDEEFDAHFLVTADDRFAVRGVLTADAMTRMLDSFATSILTSRQQTMTLSRTRAPATVADVISGIELLRVLATPDPRGLQALRALPDADVDQNGARFPDGVQIGPLVVDGQAITRAAGLAAADHAWSFEVVDGRVAAAGLQHLPIEVRDRVGALGTAGVSSHGGDAQVRWKTIETDPLRLVAGLEILRALARGPSLGAFR